MAEKEFSMEYVKYHFNDEELLEFSSATGRAFGEKQEAENELKAVKAEFKSRIERYDADLADLTTKIRNGYEMRRTKCELVKDYPNKRAHYYRVDTGELIKSRDLFESELQMGLDDV